MDRCAILLAVQNEFLRQELKVQLLQCLFNTFEGLNKTDIEKRLSQMDLALAVVSCERNDGRDGLDVVQQIRFRDKKVPLIFIPKMSSEALAIEALRAGVDDYFCLPFSCEEVVQSIKKRLSFLAADTTHTDVHNSPSPVIVGDTPCMRMIKSYLIKVAQTDTNVLITGETGTGKELVAQLIHHYSARHKKPYVCINCAAIPDNLLESELFGYERGAFTGASTAYAGKLPSAAGGSVFFDEVGDMSLFSQAKILRAIENKEVYRLGGKKSIPVDFRIIAATNHCLETAVAENKFRKDLFFRLSVARIHLPPLRERKEDIPLLINHYLPELNRRSGRRVRGFSAEVLSCLLSYAWPGNIRELKNLLEVVFINAAQDEVSMQDLPEHFHKRSGDEKFVASTERELLLSVLFSTHWNKSEAAKKLQWSRMTLYRKMAKYRIQDHVGEMQGDVMGEAIVTSVFEV